MIYCKNCGAENSKQGHFCKNCGQKLEWDTIPTGQDSKIPVQTVGTENYSDDTPVYKKPVERAVVKSRSGSKDRAIIVLVTVLAVLVAVLAGIVAWVVLGDKDNKKSNDAPSENTTIQTNGEQDSGTGEKSFDRFSTYSWDYTYKDMDEIHSSTEASDKESYKLEAVIEDYNDKWIDYVNYGDNSIFSYLREGTRAYTYAVNFGDRDISESLLFMEVNDVRKTGNIYFVWCHEKIRIYSSEEGEKIKEYHWVYKVRKDSDRFYVEDYTADPYYK